jgi:hypothetical protein
LVLIHSLPFKTKKVLTCTWHAGLPS